MYEIFITQTLCIAVLYKEAMQADANATVVHHTLL